MGLPCPVAELQPGVAWEGLGWRGNPPVPETCDPKRSCMEALRADISCMLDLRDMGAPNCRGASGRCALEAPGGGGREGKQVYCNAR